MSQIEPKGTRGISFSANGLPEWRSVAGAGPLDSFEYDERVFSFGQGLSQALVIWLKVPSWYKAGRQIFLRSSHYSPSSSNNFKFRTTSTLIRKNTDAVTSTTNQRNSTNGDVTNSVANQYREVLYDLTDGSGLINSVAVSPGDMIKVQLQRITPSGTEDTADVRMISGSSEVSF